MAILHFFTLNYQFEYFPVQNPNKTGLRSGLTTLSESHRCKSSPNLHKTHLLGVFLGCSVHASGYPQKHEEKNVWWENQLSMDIIPVTSQGSFYKSSRSINGHRKQSSNRSTSKSHQFDYDLVSYLFGGAWRLRPCSWKILLASVDYTSSFLWFKKTS